MEKDAEQAVVDVTICDIDMEVAHTPYPGPSWCMDETEGVMIVVHTHLLGPKDIQNINGQICGMYKLCGWS